MNPSAPALSHPSLTRMLAAPPPGARPRLPNEPSPTQDAHERFHADRLGIKDFALHSAGASIVRAASLTSAAYSQKGQIMPTEVRRRKQYR